MGALAFGQIMHTVVFVHLDSPVSNVKPVKSSYYLHNFNKNKLLMIKNHLNSKFLLIKVSVKNEAKRKILINNVMSIFSLHVMLALQTRAKMVPLA